MNIGIGIKKVRQEKKLSQGDLADACGISQTSLSQIEKGIKRPNTKNLEKICKILNVPETIIYLYALEESDIPKNKRKVFEMLYPTVEGLIKQLVSS